MHYSTLLREMWPILATMKVLGWLPIQRPRGTDMLYLGKYAVVYSCIMLSLQGGSAFYLFVVGFNVVQKFDIERQMFSYIQLAITLVLSPSIYIFAAISSMSHINLLNDFYKFQIGIEKLSLSRKSLTFSLNKFAKAIVITTVFWCIMIMIVRPLTMQTKLVWKYDLHVAMSMISTSIIMGWWYGIMKAINVCSKHLTSELQDLLEYNESGRTGDLVGQVVFEMRHSWLQLFNLLRASGNTFALSFATLFILVTVVLLYDTYKILSPQSYIIYSVMGNAVCFSFFNLYVICNRAHYAKQQVYHDILSALSIIKKLKITNKDKNMMLTFFTQIRRIIPDVSINGYLNIDRGFFSTIISALITNLIVLFQLKIPSRPLELNELLVFSNIDEL